ncbi:MAG: hypothetical protein A3G99_00040 [Candidatus Zambryskibacteria bacterium RIFCSPLOWO2_12_FULL_39_23]|uniref:Uncharacterized protein n=1 Tax=Candidatus Zambryskibacteria bacterium RIFCSPLOWO2_12_FULL_39_23 TaxID=1802776 RepID=A0A1G2US32_9BACT|nr:MAG: hypothetical protein A3E59_01115 [Candidatus Zambryskibacteria bacterium RIFCSPHIGHO2_12_FULL_39_47]OHB12215.1 MAG: hypothetical protein A3G99_00040 [Candidatus Zambryskibacteria bacterium RIFCSPLOWO2_12_FULL_39_23]
MTMGFENPPGCPSTLAAIINRPATTNNPIDRKYRIVSRIETSTDNYIPTYIESQVNLDTKKPPYIAVFWCTLYRALLWYRGISFFILFRSANLVNHIGRLA